MERGNTTRGGGRGEKEGEGGATGLDGTNPIKRKHATTTGGNGSDSNNNNNNNNKKQKSPHTRPPPPPSPAPASSMLLAQSRPCLVQCLSYLDSESIRQVCLLSKEYHSLIHNDPVMANTWTKALEIRPSSSDDNAKYWGYLDQLVDQLYHHHNELQMIQEIRIIDPHRFKCSDWGKIKAMIQRFQLGGIVSLHMVSPSTLERVNNIDGIFDALPLPRRNLRVIDLSNCIFYNTIFTKATSLASFLKDCSSLEQITFNTIHKETTALNITGTELKNCSSLTEINMDDSTFVGYNAGLSNLKNKYSKRFFFGSAAIKSYGTCPSKMRRTIVMSWHR